MRTILLTSSEKAFNCVFVFFDKFFDCVLLFDKMKCFTF